MRRRLFSTAAAIALALGGCVCSMADAQPAVVETESAQVGAIEGQIAKYAAAVNAEPVDLTLAEQVWANSPDVSFIHPLGHEHGWDAVKRNFYQNTMEALFSERKLTTRDIHVHVYGDAAWAEFYWHFTAKLRSNGSTVQTDGRETQVYRRASGNRWELVHVHYSAMPANVGRKQ